MTAETTFQPTQQNPVAPDLRALNVAQSLETRKLMNCARPGVIQAFDAANQTATIQIAQQNITSVSPAGVKTFAAFAQLENVPVVFPCGGGFTLTFPITAGDECLIVFNDREIDNWLLSGGTETVPTTMRLHDMSDAFAIVGVRSYPRSLSGVSSSSTQLRSDDGTTFVEVNAQGLRLHAGTVYEWDVHGYGQKIEWTGGSNYTITNYTTGAIITTVNASIDPPGPP